jgi:DNA polymerase-3 subunit gamma/tau
VRPSLRGIVRALYTSVDVLGADGSTVSMAAPNGTHRDKCEQHRGAVEQAWVAATGRPVTIDLTVGGGGGGGGGDHDHTPAAPRPGDRAPQPAVAEPDESIDLDELVDAAPGQTPTTLDRIAEAFPGVELVERKEA